MEGGGLAAFLTFFAWRRKLVSSGTEEGKHHCDGSLLTEICEGSGSQQETFQGYCVIVSFCLVLRRVGVPAGGSGAGKAPRRCHMPRPCC